MTNLVGNGKFHIMNCLSYIIELAVPEVKVVSKVFPEFSAKIDKLSARIITHYLVYSKFLFA